MISVMLRLILSVFFYSSCSVFVSRITGLEPLEATGISALVTSLVFYNYYKIDQEKRGNYPAISLNLKGCVPYIILLGSAFCLLGNNLINIFHLTKLSYGYVQVQESLYSSPFLIQILCSGLIIPVAEEFIFRGLIYASIRDRLPFLPAALITSLLFALFHGNLPQGVYAFLLGMAMTWVYEACGTLAAAVIFHQAANLLSLFITKLPGLYNFIASDSRGITFAVTTCSAIIAVWCILIIKRKTNNKEVSV